MNEDKVENPINMTTGAPCTEDELHELDISHLAVDTRPFLNGVEIYLSFNIW